ncbi:MAG: hypothetical protein JJ934_19535 [Pseudomonadales bacterium]|nr:hypothetical protein [Pseudomonadales bacterium]
MWFILLIPGKPPSADIFPLLKDRILKLSQSDHSLRRSYEESIASLVLWGWLTKNEEGQRLVASEEFKRWLLESDEAYRTSCLWLVSRWSSSKDSALYGELYEFLGKVWPKELRVQTSKTAAQMCEIAFNNSERFAEIEPLVERFLVEIEDHGINLLDDEKSIAEQHPVQMSNLLFRAVSDNVHRWPWGMEEVLEIIEATGPEAFSCESFLELKRMWDSR